MPQGHERRTSPTDDRARPALRTGGHGWTSAVLLALLLGGCGNSGPIRGEMEVWVAERDRRIGDMDHPDQILGHIGGVVPLNDGRVWIAHTDGAAVYLYDEEGRIEARFGRLGEGPTEFRMPSRLGWMGRVGDTLWVEESYHESVSLFTPEGRYARTIPLQSIRYQEVFRVREPFAMLADGTALARADHDPLVLEGLGYEVDDPEWTTFPVVRYDPERGEVLEELFRVDGTGFEIFRWDEGGTSMVNRFPDHPLVAGAPDASRIVVVERRRPTSPGGAEFRVTAIAPSGDTLWSRTYPYEPDPFPGEEAETVMAGQIEQLRAYAQSEANVDPDYAEDLYHRAVSPPEFRTPVTSVQVGSDGKVWLERSGPSGEPREWWVLDGDGNPHARWEMEPGVEVRWVGVDEVWGVSRNVLGLSSVFRYRVGR